MVYEVQLQILYLWYVWNWKNCLKLLCQKVRSNFRVQFCVLDKKEEFVCREQSPDVTVARKNPFASLHTQSCPSAKQCTWAVHSHRLRCLVKRVNVITSHVVQIYAASKWVVPRCVIIWMANWVGDDIGWQLVEATQLWELVMGNKVVLHVLSW